MENWVRDLDGALSTTFLRDLGRKEMAPAIRSSDTETLLNEASCRSLGLGSALGKKSC